MGRHSMNYKPGFQAAPQGSIDPPGAPVDPTMPGPGQVPNPQMPDPSSPEPGPNSPEITPSEPPPYAPDEAGDGSVPAPTWHSAGERVL